MKHDTKSWAEEQTNDAESDNTNKVSGPGSDSKEEMLT